MDYIEYKFSCTTQDNCEIIKDIIVATIADFGFDSFDEDEQFLRAYITEKEHETAKEQISQYIETLEGVEVQISKIETVNWNKEWESNFEPIDVDGICTIRAPFHQATDSKFEIVIMPKMSFGTGHHATTHLMVATILSSDLEGKTGLDMGSGTGVLAIAALKNGAKAMDCVDIDEWAYENCIENFEMNGVSDSATAFLGDVAAIKGKNYDFIVANINRNILLADMASYVETLNSNGVVIMSGFLDIDIDDIVEKGNSLGLSLVSTIEKDGWASVKMAKA